MSTFDKALSITLQFEGGFSHHPLDPGGATNKGVTQRTYNHFRAKHGLPQRSVVYIDDNEVRSIYKSGYWDAAKCDLYSDRLAIAVFDFAVNSGPRIALLNLQRVLGVEQDAIVGPGTLGAIKMISEQELLEKYLTRRAAMFQNLALHRPSNKVFLKGWMNRVNALRKALKV